MLDTVNERESEIWAFVLFSKWNCGCDSGFSYILSVAISGQMFGFYVDES